MVVRSTTRLRTDVDGGPRRRESAGAGGWHQERSQTARSEAGSWRRPADGSDRGRIRVDAAIRVCACWAVCRSRDPAGCNRDVWGDCLFCEPANFRVWVAHGTGRSASRCLAAGSRSSRQTRFLRHSTRHCVGTGIGTGAQQHHLQHQSCRSVDLHCSWFDGCYDCGLRVLPSSETSNKDEPDDGSTGRVGTRRGCAMAASSR
jgi:hypothetical protein